MKKSRRIGHVFSTPEAELSAFKCPYCDKQYQTEANLKKHIAEKHGDKAENNPEE